MRPETIELCRKSWAQLQPVQAEAGKLFYELLFEKDPALRPMFKHSIEVQATKLMSMVSAALNLLDNLEGLLPVVKDLGKRHALYGAKPEHYQTVGDTLIRTIEIGVGDNFTSEVRQAWVDLYTLISEVMLAAQREVEAEALS